MRIAIVGAGGVGGYLAARLAQAGCPVAVVARGAHLQAIRAAGLQLTSVAGDFLARDLEATDAPAQIGPVDAIFVCTKAWQVPAAAAALAPMLGPDTLVVPLQNGVEAADQLATVVGPQRVLGGLFRIVSFLDGPGRVRHAGLEPQMEFGERDGRRTDRVGALLAQFERVFGIQVAVPDSIEAALWEKFLFIAPVSGVGATTRVPIGEFRAIAQTRGMLELAMHEVAALARARGVPLAEGAIERTLRFVDNLPPTATTSMQRDLMEGRPSELEAQSGAVVRLARAAGLAVPVNECLYRALLPAELRARRQ